MVRLFLALILSIGFTIQAQAQNESISDLQKQINDAISSQSKLKLDQNDINNRMNKWKKAQDQTDAVIKKADEILSQCTGIWDDITHS